MKLNILKLHKILPINMNELEAKSYLTKLGVPRILIMTVTAYLELLADYTKQCLYVINVPAISFIV